MTTDSLSALLHSDSTAEHSDGTQLSLRERQQRQTAQDLIRAALETIAERGLEETTVQRITARAGTSRATLYAHFPHGRNEVYIQAYNTLGQRLIDRAERLAAEQSQWVERLCAYAQAMVELAAQRQLGLFYNVSGPRLTGMKYQGSGSQRTVVAFTKELDNAKQHGELAEHLDVEAISTLLVGSIREAGIDTAREPSHATRSVNAFRQLLETLRSAT